MVEESVVDLLEVRTWSLDLVQALWKLGLFPKDRLPEVAVEALGRGESEAVWLPLARFDRMSLDGIDETFDKVLGQSPNIRLDLRECILKVAKEFSKLISAGKVSPREGVRLIDRHVYYKTAPPEDYLGPLSYWASEFDVADSEDRRRLCESGIKDAAASILRLNRPPEKPVC
jgi:hypothetical protein